MTANRLQQKMMSLKKRIEAFLEARDQTFEDLAEYLDVSLDELNRGLKDSSLEVRTLENISKALRIPLYSFFPGSGIPDDKMVIPYYTRKLPKEELEKVLSEEKVLEKEIKFLEKYIQKRAEQLKSLKSPDRKK